MDAETIPGHRADMRRRILFLVLAVTLLLGSWPAPAYAQNGVCPDDTEFLGFPPGWSPSGSPLCKPEGESGNLMSMVWGSEMPCNGGVSVDRNWIDTLPGQLTTQEPWFTYVINPDMPFPSNYAVIQFYITTKSGVVNTDYTGPLEMRIESYNHLRVRIGSTTLRTDHATRIDGHFGPTYHVNTTLRASPGGYITLEKVYPGPNVILEYWIFSLIVYDSFFPPPPMCMIPGSAVEATSTPTATTTATNTPTLTPSPSPTGTWDPTPTHTPTQTTTPHTPTHTPTPWATQSMPTITTTPRATETPRPFNTLPPPFTPTLIPGSDMPGLIIPGFDFPDLGDVDEEVEFSIGLTPNATTEARIEAIATQAGIGGDIATRWYTSTEQSLSWLSTDITTTTGISSPVQIAGTLTGSLTTPISWVKAMQLYLPNLWPMILFLLLVTIWMFFILIVKFSIAVVADSGDVLRRIIELIPGM